MTRNQLRQRIVRNLGGGMIKTELCTEHLDDAINNARDMWIMWTDGNATMEVYFLLLLRAGQHVYDLPAGLTDVIGYRDKMGGIGGIDNSFGGYGPARWYTGGEQGNSAFFALSNPSWSGLGYNTSGNGTGLYTAVDSYLALSHLELIKKMRHDKYQWRYHKFVNQLELIPTPECGNQLQVGSVPSSGGCPGEFDEYETIDSPGYIMIHGQMMEGASLPTYTPSVSGTIDPDGVSLYPEADENYLEYIFSHPWIINYSTAYVKQTLGLIRRKFSQNSSLGGSAISLDGDSLVSEAREDMERLEAELDLKYADGFDIVMG